MRLPSITEPINDWEPQDLEPWVVLGERAAKMSEAVGSNDAFDQMVTTLRNMSSTNRFDKLPELLKRRLTARALTWLWLNDDHFTSRMLNPTLLKNLIKAQAPRLTRMTLQQLAQVYFRRFDELDKQAEIRELLEKKLLQQLEIMPPPKIDANWVDPLVTLQREGSWLLSFEGPAKLVERVRNEGRELGETFTELGLQGFDEGRYGDVCRTHFYLETLRSIPLGAYDPVFDELLKPSVSKAPYEAKRRIGHVALEILIDRVTQEPSDAWQEFVISLAGDPRIASSARNFREWWQPLGEARIQKVRGWLSREDLRLFLQALEQYGVETQNEGLQRMFPARKTFLEGLFKLKLIRSSRLLLGRKASETVKRILGKDVKTSFALMDGRMNDKAVIYLDCGDFHLVEGSHDFRIWVYLAPPSRLLSTYERNYFADTDLTKTVPKEYSQTYPGLPFGSFVHNPTTWQNNVLNFLADNGIELNIEQLLSPEDYQQILRRFGLPVVKRNVTLNRTPVTLERSASSNSSTSLSSKKNKTKEPSATAQKILSSNWGSKTEKKNVEARGEVIRTSRLAIESEKPVQKSLSSSTHKNTLNISHLDSFEMNVLRYFYKNPGKRARYAADSLGVDRSKVNRALYGTLKSFCRKGRNHGWKLTETAYSELKKYDKQG